MECQAHPVMGRACTLAALAFALILLSACGGSSSSPPPPPSGSLSYPSATQTFTVGTAVTPITPTITGTLSGFTVSPALPAGLSLDAAKGTISGTPTVLAPAATYTVSAMVSGGTTTSGSVSIAVEDIAPSQVSYGASSFSFSATVPITELTPTTAGGPVVSWSISPALPAGLNFNTTDGSISGTPSAVSASARYVVTAQNSGGHSTVSLTITVDDIAPSQVSYGASSFSFSATVPSTKLTPTSAGGSVVSWSISPALPAGLNFNTTDGSISGTPSAVSASASYVVTAQNSGGQSTVSLTIAVNAGPLLTLGHQSGIAATRATATRVLSVEFGLPQHWILWDYAAASVIATGTAGCGPTGSCPQNLIDMAGSTAVIVGPTGFEIRAASDGQVLGNISKPFVVNWMLATDGSYIATWGGTDLSAWSTSGQLLFSKSGNYGGASVFAAPNELRVAWGPAGQSVVETIAVPGGASTTGPQFNGLFSSWFTDGTRFITLAGSTALIYSKDGVQLGSIASVPAAATLVGQGNWVLVNPNYNPPITIYPAAGVTPAPAATYNLGAPVVALASGMTIGVLHENSSVMNVIDLSGAAPVKADYTAPVRLNGQPGTAPPYAAASASQWVVGNPDGVLLDGASLAGTPRYFGFGRAWSIAGGTGHFAIATALRTILYFNSGTLAMEGQIAFPASELTMSADGTLLAAQGASDAYGVYPVQVYNLPAASLQYTWPYTYSSASGGVIPRDIILSASGNVLGQVLNTLPAGTITLQASAPTGGSTIFSIPVSSPSDIRYWPAIRITPDGTLVAAQTVAASGQMPAANLLQNGTLVTAFSGLPGGWLDNSRLLVNNYTATPDALILYSGCSIYGPNGSPTSAACALPEEVRRLQPLTSDTIFIPATNQIRVVSTGALSWMSGDAFEWQQSPQAAVAGSTVIFVSGIDLLAQSF